MLVGVRTPVAPPLDFVIGDKVGEERGDAQNASPKGVAGDCVDPRDAEVGE